MILEKVETKKQVKEFVNFPLKLYKKCPYYVPQFYGDELKAFDLNNRDTEKYYLEAFLVKNDNGNVLGRVAAVVHKQYNNLYNAKTVRFTRIDFVNDINVVKMLMSAVENFAKEQKMDKIIGPMGMIDQDREGLLTDGFDLISTFALNYNYNYYFDLLKQCGYKVDAEWDEWQITPDSLDENRFKRMNEVVLKRYKLHLLTKGSTKSIINEYKYKIFDLINETYGHLYGYVPVTHADVDRLVKSFSIALKKDYLCIVLNEQNEVVAFGLTMPSIAKAVNEGNGKMNLKGIVKLLNAINHPQVMELLLIGVKDEYKHSGLPFVIFNSIMAIAKKKKLKYAETNAQLKSNNEIHKLFEHFNPKKVRERVALCKEIKID